MTERVSDERLAECIQNAEADCCGHADQDFVRLYADTAAALRELQQWRSGIEPSTGHPIGKLVVMETWMEET